MTWSINSWKNYPTKQQPEWFDLSLVENIKSQISNLPALVFAGECRKLKEELVEIDNGNSFILQAGECSENFTHCNGPYIHSYLKVFLQMATILSFSSGKKVVKVGRIAGQYAKPRSSDIEIVNNNCIPSYKGDMINSAVAEIKSRRHDPSRMLDGYFRSASTLNLIRAFTKGGFASLSMIENWFDQYYDLMNAFPEYKELIDEIIRCLKFVKSFGINIHSGSFEESDFYTSHEALLLDYEECLTRIDTTTGDFYDLSAHMLWIGDRTRQLNGGHIEFLRGVKNPIGIKIGTSFEISDIKSIINTLNPNNEKGRLSIITRYGYKKIDDHLNKLIKEVKAEGFNVTWICDPMHGNTFSTINSIKTRDFTHIISEIKQFWEIHRLNNTIPGGVHLELTGDHVTECIGGRSNLTSDLLNSNYKSSCDPRLNAKQAIELALELSSIINS